MILVREDPPFQHTWKKKKKTNNRNTSKALWAGRHKHIYRFIGEDDTKPDMEIFIFH